MRKEDNDWSIDMQKMLGDSLGEIEINKTIYIVSEDTACIAHCILLLVDSINDKGFSR